jgi:hypothetical protein
MVECFTPFLRSLLALPLSGTTWRRHRDNVWVLGGEVIRRLQMDSTLREAPVAEVVLDLIGDDGGPLLSRGQSEAEQRAFDATCRRLFRFLTQSQTSHGHRRSRNQQRTRCAIDSTDGPATPVTVKPRSRIEGHRRHRA